MLDSQTERPVLVRFIKTEGNLRDSIKSEVVAQNLRFVRHLIRKFVVLSQNADIDVARWPRFLLVENATNLPIKSKPPY